MNNAPAFISRDAVCSISNNHFSSLNILNQWRKNNIPQYFPKYWDMSKTQGYLLPLIINGMQERE